MEPVEPQRHRRHRQTGRTQFGDGCHIPAPLHAAPVFPPPTALVAHHSRCPPLGLRRAAFHFRTALGIADAARGPRGYVGVVATGVDRCRAFGRRIHRCGSSAIRQPTRYAINSDKHNSHRHIVIQPDYIDRICEIGNDGTASNTILNVNRRGNKLKRNRLFSQCPSKE